MKKSSINIIYIILITIIVILGIKIYDRFNKIVKIPSCNDPRIVNEVQNVLDSEFKKIAILFNGGKPIKIEIKSINEVGTKNLLKSFFRYGLVSNKIKTCSIDLEMDNGKVVKKLPPIIFKIYHKSYIDNGLKTIDNITIFNLYEDSKIDK